MGDDETAHASNAQRSARRRTQLAARPLSTIIGFQTPDALLYHYTRMETAKEKIIPGRSLMIGSISKTNDPKEVREWRFSLRTNRNADLLAHDMDELSAKLSTALKANTKVVCFSQDSKPLSGDHTRDIFLRGWGKPRMWAYYAEKHSGVCLVFDRKNLDQAICRKFGFCAKIWRDSVAYINRPIANDWQGDFMVNIDHLNSLGFERYAEAHFHTFVKPLFFEKMVDWRDEQEFRWIVLDNNPNDAFVDISESLVGVIYGEDAKKEDIESIIEQTRDLELDHMGLKWRNSSPWYDFINSMYRWEDESAPNQTGL